MYTGLEKFSPISKIILAHSSCAIPNLGGVSLAFTSDEDVARRGSKLTSLTFLTPSRRSTSKHARAYSRFSAACAFASPSVSCKSPQEVDQPKAYDVFGVCSDLYDRPFLPLAIVTYLFAFFLTEVVKKCVDAKCGHTWVRARSLRMHTIMIDSGDRPKELGWPAGLTKWYTSSSSKNPMKAPGRPARKMHMAPPVS